MKSFERKKEYKMSNEKIIRELAKEFLLDKYKNSVIKDEFGTFLDVRSDIVCLNKEHIVVVEVKSDKDTFARLEKQLIGYKSFATGIYVALDEKHYNNFIEKFIKRNLKFSNIGILVYNNKDNRLELKRDITKHYKLPFLYSLLTTQELNLFFYYFKDKSKISKNLSSLTEIIENIFTYREIYNISHKLFLNRFFKKEIYTKELIKDFEYKQNLFNRYLKEENWNMLNGRRYNLKEETK